MFELLAVDEEEEEPLPDEPVEPDDTMCVEEGCEPRLLGGGVSW